MLVVTDGDALNNLDFEQDFTNPDNPKGILMVNYITTFENIMGYYELSAEYEVGGSIYELSGFYMGRDKIDNLSAYLDSLTYDNEISIYLNALYKIKNND